MLSGAVQQIDISASDAHWECLKVKNYFNDSIRAETKNFIPKIS